MFRSLTLAQQIAFGVLFPFLFLLLTLTPYSYYNNSAGIAASRRATQTQAVLLSASEVLSALSTAESAARGYVLTGKDDAVTSFREASSQAYAKMEELSRLTAGTSEQELRVTALQQFLREVQRELTEVMDARRNLSVAAATDLLANGRGQRVMEEARKLTAALSASQTEQLRQYTIEAENSARKGLLFTIWCVPFCLGIMVGAVVLIIRNLNRQIGTVIQHLRSSATELQAAATQQAKGAKGQAATATEVATTMRELVSTSRQIADSTQRVTGIATETTTAARAGDSTMQSAQTAVQQIKYQVDRIVSHMLDLGKRSQEIGSILDIINELAEQTNILAINATIEAAGAGDAGRRFAVVADEIRKLADRVGGSTKEIRSLIEEVRAAATTTVMVTEDGSKAVDSSARQFSEVAGSFRRIVELVGNTTQASREIELSTKQQTTAVEQASTAITEVAQTARETDASSAQMMQTAAQLATLSQQLIALVRRSVQD